MERMYFWGQFGPPQPSFGPLKNIPLDPSLLTTPNHTLT